MKLHTLSFLLLIEVASGVSCASPQLPFSDELVAQAFDERAVATITTSQSCFSGPFENYSSWLDHLRQTEPRLNVDAISRRISAQRFEEAKHNFDCQKFQYLVGDVTVEGYSIRKLSLEGRLPVVIYNRGGNASHSRIEFRTLFQRLFHLGDQGFFVIASQYRGSGLSGTDIDPGVDEFGGSDVDDVVALFDLIDGSPFADKTRIGMFGWSRGAIMTFLVATRTDRLSALVVGGAPTDIEEELKNRPKMEAVFRARIPNYENNREAALQSRSVLYWSDSLPKSIPILIIHGQSDSNVRVESALSFARELQKLGIPYRLVIYEKGRHALLEYREAVNNEISTWFGNKLN